MKIELTQKEKTLIIKAVELVEKLCDINYSFCFDEKPKELMDEYSNILEKLKG